jgi:hypothetical protein
MDGIAERLGDFVDRLRRKAQAFLVERLLVAAPHGVEERLAFDLLV